MFFSNYYRLSQRESYPEEKQDIHSEDRTSSLKAWKYICAALTISLAASVLANAFLFYGLRIRPQPDYYSAPSQYTGLRYDVPKRAEPEHQYWTLNRTLQDAVWGDQRLDGASLFVALDESYVASQRLPHAMRWPWDQNKGVYMLAAGHQMHCLHSLRSWINDKEDGKQDADMTWSYEHIFHCLNTLRETVMCFADDVPLYTGHVNENVHYKLSASGRGMKRMCRNWDALKVWADEHSACYSADDPTNTDIAEIDRYKHCPDGSRPWQKRTDV